MKFATLALASALSIATVGIAVADDARCSPASGQNALTLEQAAGKAEALGYAVKEIKRSKNCWKIEGFDRHGAQIEIRFDPASGDVVKPRDWRASSAGK